MGLFDRWRRREAATEEEDPRKALYVHLAWDGAIFVIRGETGEQLWVDEDGLEHELRATKERGGALLYSRERPDEEPPEHIEATFARVLGFELPIKLLEEPHPEALVPPEKRRSIVRDES